MKLLEIKVLTQITKQPVMLVIAEVVAFVGAHGVTTHAVVKNYFLVLALARFRFYA